MRHRVGKKKLNRSTSHRSALLRNLSTSLVENGYIITTLAKAKTVKPYVEKLITKAKSDNSFTTIQRIKAQLYTESAVRKLVTEIAPSYSSRNGGYTRIIKHGFRAGDKAPMAKLELVAVKKSSPKTTGKSEKAKVATKNSEQAGEKSSKPAASSKKKSVSKAKSPVKKATKTKVSTSKKPVKKDTNDE